MVHGTSHHLGLDVHDCAQARREVYREGTLEPGMVITVEPGLYFNRDDELLPAELRGIGVRIEDDIAITATGNVNLSGGVAAAAAPRWSPGWPRSGPVPAPPGVGGYRIMTTTTPRRVPARRSSR